MNLSVTSPKPWPVTACATSRRRCLGQGEVGHPMNWAKVLGGVYAIALTRIGLGHRPV